MTQATGIRTMDSEAQAAAPAGLLRTYKGGQGVVTRRIAFWTGAGLAAWGARDLWIWLQGFGALQRPIVGSPVAGIDLSHLPLGGPALSLSVVIAVVVAAAAWIWVSWFLKRPWLADLLIETEGEMKKVSWPARDEAVAATKVVSATVVAFTLVLLVFDVVLTEVMNLLTGMRL